MAFKLETLQVVLGAVLDPSGHAIIQTENPQEYSQERLHNHADPFRHPIINDD
jgi:hypothetical protein